MGPSCPSNWSATPGLLPCLCPWYTRHSSLPTRNLLTSLEGKEREVTATGRVWRFCSSRLSWREGGREGGKGRERGREGGREGGREVGRI